MANEVDDIVQNVVLTGNEEVAAAFDKMADAGERAFEALSRAFEHGATSFAGLATALVGIGASFAIAGVGIFEFVKHTEEGVSALSDLAEAAGTTTEEMSGIKAAFAAGGVSSGQLEQAFKRLSISIQQSWTEIKQASRQSADQLKGDALSVSNAQLALGDALRKVANIERDQAVQAKQNLAGVAGAQQTLNELNSKRLASLGVDTSALDDQLAKNREMLAIKQAQLALEQAKTKQAEDAANAEDEALKAANAAKLARITLNQAERKEQDDIKNDINNVAKAVKEVADGNSGALNSINASAENIAKGIIKSAADSGHALTELKGDISDLASPAPEVKETFLQIGKVLKGIEDPALKSAVAARLLGRTISQDFLNVLENPEAIESFIKRIEDLGLAVDETDKKVSEKFRSALFGLQNDIELIGNKMATAFGPGLTTILTALDAAIVANRQKFIDFATSIASSVVPVIDGLIRVLSDAAQPQDQWIADYVSELALFGRALKDVVVGVAKFAAFIIESFTAVADDINKVFGTNITGFDIFFAAFVLSATNAFGIVTVVIQTFVATINALIAPLGITFAAVFAPIAAGALIATSGLYALVKAWQALRDIVGIGKESHFDAVLEGTVSRAKALAEILSGDVKKGWEDLKAANAKQAEDEKAIDEKSADTKKKLVTDVTEVEKKTNDDAAHNYASARAKINEASKASADSRIADNERVASSEKQAADATQQKQESNKKAAQTDGSFIDENGIRNFGSGGGGGGKQSILASQMEAFLKETKDLELTESFFGASFGRKAVVQGASPGGAEVSHPTVTENPPLPRPRPTKEDLKPLAEAVESGVEKGVEKNDINPQNLPDALTPPFPGEFPTPPAQVPLDAELTPFKSLNDIGDNIRSVLDNIANKLDITKEPVSPNAQDNITTSFDAMKSALESIVSTLREVAQNLTNNNQQQQQESSERTRSLQQATPQDASQTSLLESVLNSLESFLSNNANKDTTVQPNEQGSVGIRGDAEQIDEAFQTAASSIESGAQAVVSALESAAQSISAAANNSNASSGTVTAAGGGYIQGPGTTTSDSIFARLSNKEYVHQAKAVSFWGVDFMHAINNMQMPRFNMGGLVGLLSPSLPRFRDGGVVSNDGVGAMPHLGSVDLRTDHGSARVVVDRGGLNQLRKAAVMRNIGKEKQPSWVK